MSYTFDNPHSLDQNSQQPGLSDECMHSILDAIDQASILLNVNLEIVFLNRACKTLLSLKNEDVIGRNILDPLFNQTSLATLKGLLLSVQGKIQTPEQFTSGLKWVHSIQNNTSEVSGYYQLLGNPIFSNHQSLTGYLIAITDITPQLQVSQENFDKLFNQGILNVSRDPIFTLDSSFSIISMNDSARQLFLDSKDGYLGAKLEDIIRISPNRTYRHFIFDALAKQKDNEYLEINVYDKKGKEYYFEVSAGTVKLADQSIYTVILHDTSIRKHYEDLLQEELDQACRENKAKSSFLAVMSHEMRTPLIGILGVHELLQDTQLNEDQSRYIDIATHSSRTLLNLINGILDFSKIEAGKLELEMLTFNPEETVYQVVEILASSAFKKGISLQTYIDPELPGQIISDPVRLHQVLMNLTNNAIKFTKHGGISVLVLKSPTNPHEIVFEVSDTGIGIAKDQLSNLFDEFTQAEASTNRNYGGSGLGLAISKRLVKLLGGNLDVESQPGEGSRFWFNIQSREPITDNNETSPIDIENIKILLIDQSPVSSALISRQLQDYTQSLVLANNQDAAIQLLSESNTHFHIIIVNSYKLNGNFNDLCEALINSRINHQSHCILTGLPETLRATKNRHDSLFATAIPLPIRRSTLLQRINLLLNEGKDDYKPELTKSKPVQPNNNGQINVLVADDSLTNRIVTESMLKQAGYQVYLANNGQEAIEQLCQNPVDIVLMDLSMPVMDGIEATVQIRMQNNYTQLPIIALTATALQEDIDACLKAGMTDYLGKPFTKQTLFDKIEEWTKQLKNDPRSISSLRPHSGQDSKFATDIDYTEYIDMETLNQVSDDLSSEILTEMLGLFINESYKRLDQIQELLATHDYKEIGNQAHAIKGSSSTFGAKLLSPLAEDLELACKNNHSINEIENLTVQLLDVGKQTLKAYTNLN